MIESKGFLALPPLSALRSYDPGLEEGKGCSKVVGLGLGQPVARKG